MNILATCRTLLTLASLLIATLAFGHEPTVTSKAQVEGTPFPGHLTYLLADGDNTPSNVAFLELELPARTFGAPPHVHAQEDEHFYVLEGQVEFLDRDQVISAGPNSLVVLPRGNLHGFWNITDQDARLLLVVSPGEFASFFDDVVATIRAEHPGDAQAVGAIISRVAAEHEVTVHPDKVPESALPLLPR